MLAENQISMDWDNTLWGSDLRLYDEDGNERFALVLGPGEKLVLEAYLEVPLTNQNQQSVSIGDYVETSLTMCVDGDESCQTVELTFIASGVVSRSHIRSVPTTNLVWNIEGDKPSGTDTLTWSLSSSGMAKTGWIWSSSGDLSINGDLVTLNVTGGSGEGSLILDLPSTVKASFSLLRRLK